MKALIVGLVLAAGGSSGISAASDAGAPDAGTPDRDQEIVDHLQEIELLELLQNLELFDTAPQDAPDGGS